MVDNFTLAKMRARHASVYKLKDRTFGRRLNRDYNTEFLAHAGDVSNKFKAIVQMSTYNYSIESRILDYQKISAPLSANVKVGDSLYWPRLDKNYLVFADRDTEKNYTLCYMSEASYNITWYDKYGNKHQQLGSFLQTSKETIKTVGNYFDYLDATMQLLLKATDAAKELTYYDRIWIDEKNWQIVGKSFNVFPGMIAFYLKEVPLNKEEDTTDGLPEGVEIVTTSIISSIDDLKELTIGAEINLDLRTAVNGNIYLDSYTIETENCSYKENANSISFDTVGSAKITIKSKLTDLSRIYLIEVKETPTEEKVSYEIEGNSSVKTYLTYEYKLYKNVNGNRTLIDGNWSTDTDQAEIVKIENKICYVKMKDTPLVFTLKSSVDGQEIEKEISINDII